MRSFEKNKSTWLGIVASVFLVALVVLLALRFTPHIDVRGTPAGSVEGTASSSREIPPGAREYRSEQYHFSVLYPEELSVLEYNEGGGASTITFQNVERGEGFQLFILPYAEVQVSEARFKKDEPSGVRTDAKDISIDGAVGTSFYSTSLSLGETAEVWFIQGGYLYEVTTLKPSAGWLASILATWKFI